MRGVELAADVQDLRVVHFAWAVHLVLIHAMQSLSRGRGRDARYDRYGSDSAMS
jgi:hypothetical protein